MDTTTNLLLFGVIICQLLLFLLSLVLIKRQMLSLTRAVLSYFVQQPEEKQSKFADTLDNMAGRFAAAIVASLKGFLMGENSAALRQEKAAARADLLASNPLMGFAAKYAPGLIRKNPELAQLALNFFQGQRQEAKAENNGHEPVNSGSPFKI